MWMQHQQHHPKDIAGKLKLNWEKIVQISTDISEQSFPN